MKTFHLFALLLVSGAFCRSNEAHAAVTANTTASGVAYFTIDRGAWATVAPSAEYTDIHGSWLGTSGSTADADGQRWMFADRVESSSFGNAKYPSDYLTPLPDTALGGVFNLPVNTYGVNSFGTGNKITDYNSTTNPYGYIGLGGSIRVTSDFNEPGASVWWEHLALYQDSTDNIWKIGATSGAGRGSIFELTNVVANTVNGNLQLSGDYVFGNTDWYNFLNGTNGDVSSTAVLGHFQLDAAPEPSKFLLTGLGAMLMLLRRRRAGAH